VAPSFGYTYLKTLDIFRLHRGEPKTSESASTFAGGARLLLLQLCNTSSAALSTLDLFTAATATPELLEIAWLSPGNGWHAKCIAG
jgi:hypothetical protein